MKRKEVYRLSGYEEYRYIGAKQAPEVPWRRIYGNTVGEQNDPAEQDQSGFRHEAACVKSDADQSIAPGFQQCRGNEYSKRYEV